MKRRLWKLVLVCLSVVSIYSINQSVKVHADSLFFQLKESSQATWVDGATIRNIPPSTSGIGVPFGAKLRVDIFLASKMGPLETIISLRTSSGVSFYPYYPGILQINDRNASAVEYQNYINSGSTYTLSTNDTRFRVEVQSLGSTQNIVSLNMGVYAPSITQGSNTHRSEHAFYGRFDAQKIHTVNFYDESNLIDTQSIIDGGRINMPEIWREGYELLGFNQSRDGTGIYLIQQEIKQSMDVYAIFKVKHFKVTFYVDGEVYKEKNVAYGNRANIANPKDKKKNKFVAWNVDLSRITSDTSAHAIFEKDAKQKANFRILATDTGDGGIELFKDIIIEWNKNIASSKKSSGVQIIQKVKTSRNMQPLGLLPFLFVLGFLVWKIKFQKNERIK